MLQLWVVLLAQNLWVEEEEEAETEISTRERDEKDENPCLGEELSVTQTKEVREVLRRHVKVMSEIPGKTELVQHNVDVGGAKPIRLAPYWVPQCHMVWLKEELGRILEDGVIVESNSSWGAPIILVKKKNGMTRLFVDFRRLNSLTALDAYPMPCIVELIDKMGGATYLTTLDLARGYWQVPITENAKEKTALVTPHGLFHFEVMPFGLNGAPATFQRLMDRAVKEMVEYGAVYLDDIVVFSATWEDHLIQVENVLKRLEKANLTTKPSKCQVGMRSCTYLGHIVGSGMVRPEESKVEAIRQFSRPLTKKELRIFLGLSGYYRKFILSNSAVADPLTDLMRKSRSNKVMWSDQCEVAFRTLKEAMCSQPVLRSPDYTQEFVLQTDASDRGMGAVLGQVDKEGEEHPVSYFSKKFLPREEKYSAIKMECLAVKLGAQAFRIHLLGREFVVVTDHQALEWLERMRNDNSRLTRLSLSLQSFHFKIRYRQGKLNGNTDALSRLGVNRLAMVNGPAVVNGSDTVSGTETVSESEMVYDAKTTLSQERGKVMSGNKLRSFKD